MKRRGSVNVKENFLSNPKIGGYNEIYQTTLNEAMRKCKRDGDFFIEPKKRGFYNYEKPSVIFFIVCCSFLQGCCRYSCQCQSYSLLLSIILLTL